MERYHSTAGDPPRRDIPADNILASLELQQLTEQFLAQGGQIQRVGVQMRETPLPYVVNGRRQALRDAGMLDPTPPAPARQAEAKPKAPRPANDVQPKPKNPKATAKPKQAQRAATEYELLVAKILMHAALGDSASDTARALHIPVSRCKAIAKQNNVRWR